MLSAGPSPSSNVVSMLAWQLHETAGPESYRLEEVPDPVPGPGQVLIRLRTAALNHLDLWVSRSLPAPPSFPHVAGGDGAGVVEGIGPGVDDVGVGDEVVIDPSLSCGECPSCLSGDSTACRSFGILGEHAWGTLAEMVVVPALNALTKPAQLGWEEAGSYGLVTGTAHRMLRRSRLSAGDLLLVVGIGGGVAAATFSLGLALDAEVHVTSTDPVKREWALANGAAGAYDSSAGFASELAAAARKADVVVDSVGAATWNQSMRSLAPGGRLAVCGATSGGTVELPLTVLFYKQLEIIGSTMFDHTEFAEVTEMVGSGQVKVPVDMVFSFDHLPEALARLDEGAQMGKVVLRVPR
jgi:zinc-binding alcohol dehydrogenase/oxidoreductase